MVDLWNLLRNGDQILNRQSIIFDYNWTHSSLYNMHSHTPTQYIYRLQSAHSTEHWGRLECILDWSEMFTFLSSLPCHAMPFYGQWTMDMVPFSFEHRVRDATGLKTKGHNDVSGGGWRCINTVYRILFDSICAMSGRVIFPQKIGWRKVSSVNYLAHAVIIIIIITFTFDRT